jgi:hypothetical protein
MDWGLTDDKFFMRSWCWECSEIASRLGLDDKLNKALDELAKEVA